MSTFLINAICCKQKSCLTFESIDCFVFADLRNRYTNAVVQEKHDQMMDFMEFESAEFQRPFQYLYKFAQQKELRGIKATVTQGTPEQCITTLLK